MVAQVLKIQDQKGVLTIPHDFEAEQAVLGSIIFENKKINEIAGILKPNSFHEESHRHIFRAMLELSDANQPIDEILLGDKLKELGRIEEVGGYAYLAELVTCVPSAGNIVYYAKIIQEHASLRNLIATTNDLGRKARDPQQNPREIISEAVQEITSLQIEENKAEFIKDILQRNFANLEEFSSNKKEITGVATGFMDLDRITSGLQPKDLIIIAARPMMGKTALALNIGVYVATRSDTKGAILIFSLEMTKEQLGVRMLSGEARIDNKKFRSGNFEDGDWDRLAKATDMLSVAQIIIDDRVGVTPFEIAATTRYWDQVLENGVSLVIVDYLQLMEGNRKDSREQQIASFSRGLKGIAKNMNIPVIALSQLNRDLEKRSNKEPQLSDLRESGAIEQDADLILFIYRDEVYNEESDKKGIAKIIIAKHRNGPTGFIELVFAGKYTRFASMSKLAPPPHMQQQTVKNVHNPQHWQHND